MNSKIDIPYNPIITHDIDRYYKWKNFKSIFGEFNRILKSQSTWSYTEAWKSFQKRQQADPFSNLIEIAELDNSKGLQSVFFIMTTKEKHPKNINDYSVDDSNVQEALKQVISIGSEVGIHPGIYTFNDQKRMQEQKDRLEESIGQDVVRSRQHYLKYIYPDTFKILESIGIENDSSILVNIGDETNSERRSTYLMEDETGRKMSVSQTPLVFMDTHHMQLKDEEILGALEDSIAPAKKNGGEIMILWHNNNISNNRERGLYKEALEVIKSQ